MQKLDLLNPSSIKYLFCDIDDTITTEGQLEADAYSALWSLHKAGIKIIPVTGRPAGWCELIARLWPVEAIIGENGAFYFKYDRQQKKMLRHYSQEEETRKANLEKIKSLGELALKRFPGTALASDQFCRIMDVAIDFCEDVDDLGLEIAEKIKEHFTSNGAVAKVSSIHVNAWFGEHSKISMCKSFCQQEIGKDFEDLQSQVCFIGDSPNDEPMFHAFENSVGVKNIEAFLDRIQSPPKYICKNDSGRGFVELAKHLLS
jgi:HAD superfamily hydrolase (TIGR01484 family)